MNTTAEKQGPQSHRNAGNEATNRMTPAAAVPSIARRKISRAEARHDMRVDAPTSEAHRIGARTSSELERRELK